MGLLFSGRQRDDDVADTVWTFQLLHALFGRAWVLACLSESADSDESTHKMINPALQRYRRGCDPLMTYVCTLHSIKLPFMCNCGPGILYFVIYSLSE